MTRLGSVLLAAVLASIAPFFWSGTARAQTTPTSAFFQGGMSNVVGAALALPIDVSEDDRVTQIVITNAGPAVFLHVLLIDDSCGEVIDFSCFVTRNETTLFEFERQWGQTELSFECTTSSTLTANPPTPTPPVPSEEFEWPVDIDRGIMFVSIEKVFPNPDDPNDPWGYRTVAGNQLLGDSTVIDFDQGEAYSFDAISFRSSDASSNDGNREYEFDDLEYSKFPARLATNFLAPEPSSHWGSEDLDAELVLFSLDFSVGSEAPEAKVSMNFYNDDEVRYSAFHTFECFDVLDLGTFDERFYEDNLGSEVGHLVLTPEKADQEPQHDTDFGNGNAFRKAPVHGWLVQTATGGYSTGSGYRYLGSNTAWGRPLANSETDLVPDGTDVPTLNALCPVAPCE